jgi:hypothetical protein
MAIPQQDVLFADIAREVIESRSGSPYSVNGERSYTRVWRVRLRKGYYTTPYLSTNAICSCPGLPLPMAPYILPETGEADINAFLVKYDAKKEFNDDWQCWLVTATYSTGTLTGGPPTWIGFGADAFGSQNMPWLEPPKIR